MEEGVIKGTGNFITVENEDGEKIELEEPEELHTYAGWKALNRQVKKGEKIELEEPEQLHTYAGWKALNRQVKRGEKSIATMQIWKHTTKKPKNESEDEQEKMFLTKAFFFTEAQTEAIAK